MLARLAVPAAVALALVAAPCRASEVLDGTWEGVITFDKSGHEPKGAPDQERTRVVISGETVRVFVQDKNAFVERKPYAFRISRQIENAVIFGSSSEPANDSGTIDTVVYTVTEQWDGSLLVEYANVRRGVYELGMQTSVSNSGRRGEGEFKNVSKP